MLTNRNQEICKNGINSHNQALVEDNIKQKLSQEKSATMDWTMAAEDGRFFSIKSILLIF